MSKYTICVNCRHHITDDEGSPRAGIWYNHTCGANPIPKVLDYVTGKRDVPYGNRHAYCRDINTDGQCRQYETAQIPGKE